MHLALLTLVQVAAAAGSGSQQLAAWRPSLKAGIK